MLKRLAFILALLCPLAASAIDFRWDPGTNGFVASGTSLFGTTQLSAITNGSCVTSTVVVTQSSFANAPFVILDFGALGAFTPTAGGFLGVWWDRSFDGGTTYETPFTCSTTQQPFQRSPDAVIPFVAAALASGNHVQSTGVVLTFPGSAKAVAWQLTGATTATANHTVTAYPYAIQY